MPYLLRPLVLLVVLALVPGTRALWADEPGEGPTVLAPGFPRTVELAEGEELEVLSLQVPADVTAVHVVGVSDVDIDLYVHPTRLDPDDFDPAQYVADSWDGLEHIQLPPASGTSTWYVHVVHPGSEERSARIGLVAGFDRVGTPLLVPGQPILLTLEPGVPSRRLPLLLPPGLAWVAVGAEAAGGRPVLEARHGRTRFPALRRGLGAMVWLPGCPVVPAGAWAVDVSRPADLPVGLRWTVELVVAAGAPLPEPGRVLLHEPLPLRGSTGTHEFEIDENDDRDAYIDVLPGTRSLEFATELAGGDVDLYLVRNHPVRTETPANWEWSSWRDGDRETLLAGGTEPLSVGRYWVRVDHASGDAGTVTLRWNLRTDLPRDGERVVDRGTLGEGALWDVEIDANVPVAWWRLAPSIGPGAHLQVLGADKDVDLLVARADTGRIVARGLTTQNDEYLRIPPDLVLPSAAGLRVGVGRWQVSREVVAGELHVSASERPLPPDRYFPPYAAWDAVPRSRPLAAAVEVRTSDGTGSGIVVSPSGLILTCHHVIEDLEPGDTARIAFPPGPRGRPRQVYEARVAVFDEELDLALLEIVSDLFGRAHNGNRPLPFVEVGDSTRLPPGSPIRIAGYGYAGSSLFASNLLVLSGTLAGVETEGSREIWLITDARLGAGNSGAGYFDAEDRVVGIHSRGIGNTGSDLGYGRPSSRIPAAWLERIRAEGGSTVRAE